MLISPKNGDNILKIGTKLKSTVTKLLYLLPSLHTLGNMYIIINNPHAFHLK